MAEYTVVKDGRSIRFETLLEALALVKMTFAGDETVEYVRDRDDDIGPAPYPLIVRRIYPDGHGHTVGCVIRTEY